MKSFMVVPALIFLAVTISQAQDIAGDWQGTLSAGGQELRLVLHITKAPDNSLNATLDSIDQPGANGIPVSSITLKDSKLDLEVEMVHGSYEGKISAAHGAKAQLYRSNSSAPSRLSRPNLSQPSPPTSTAPGWERSTPEPSS